jgi:hypothetical protein
MVDGLALFGGVVLVGVGIYGLYFGVVRREPYELVTGTETTAARDLSTPGTVELEGRVPTDATTFPSPIQGRECVLAAWSVEEWDERNDGSLRDDRGVRKASGVWSRPFEVEDDTGRVGVAPGDHAESRGLLTPVTDTAASDGVTAGPVVAEFREFPVAETVAPGDEPPERIREFVGSERAVDRQTGSITNLIDPSHGHRHRRYAERTVAPGDEVYVLGEAVPENPDAVGDFRTEDLTVRPGDGRMVVSTLGEDELRDQFRWYRAGIAGGMVAVVAGLALLAAAFGTLQLG